MKRKNYETAADYIYRIQLIDIKIVYKSHAWIIENTKQKLR